MSKIFEALKQAELARAEHQDATAAGTSTAERAERRRTARLNVQVPLFVYGYTPEGDPFDFSRPEQEVADDKVHPRPNYINRGRG